MTKMATTPICGKTFKSLLLKNQRADCNEIRYVALTMRTHHSLFKIWPWVDLDLLYAKFKFGRLGFYMEIKALQALHNAPPLH